jgi:hypothetical protein
VVHSKKNYTMEKGFVYVARLIDYEDKFVGNFFKIGKTQQQDYKIRETQLNSTHLPMDVIFVRVFETDYMSSLENILHSCLVDYRCEKSYPNRKSITTEWFDKLDEEEFHYRVDEIVRNFPNVTEINILNKISGDTQTNLSEKQDLIKAINKINRKKLEVTWNGETISGQFAYQVFVNSLTKISEIVGPEILSEECWYYSADEQRFIDTFPKSYNPNAIKSSEDYKVFVGINNQVKARVLNELITKFSINHMKVILTDVK